MRTTYYTTTTDVFIYIYMDKSGTLKGPMEPRFVTVLFSEPVSSLRREARPRRKILSDNGNTKLRPPGSTASSPRFSRPLDTLQLPASFQGHGCHLQAPPRTGPWTGRGQHGSLGPIEESRPGYALPRGAWCLGVRSVEVCGGREGATWSCWWDGGNRVF